MKQPFLFQTTNGKKSLQVVNTYVWESPLPEGRGFSIKSL